MQTTYTEIFAEISRQISSRKKALIQRALLVTWPIILSIIIGFTYKQITGVEISVFISSSLMNQVTVGTIFFLIIFYMVIMSSILKIEKMIWIDSFFDRKNLTTKESFTISKKLFWPFLKLNIVLFFRYYLIIILATPVAIIGGIYFIVLISGDGPLVFFGVYSSIIIAILAWFYFMRIKLRYIRFVFLDNYKGTSLNISDTIDTTKKLNQIFKSESFKKALFTQLGVGTAQAVTNMVINTMTSLVAAGGSMLGGVGGESVRAVAGIANVYTKEYARQIADLSRVVGMYVIYREALKQLSGNEQIENEYVYNLK